MGHAILARAARDALGLRDAALPCAARKVRRMTAFEDSYIGRLRQVVGHRLLLVPGTRLLLADAAGRILVEHRRDFGVWGLPGGMAEIGESYEAAARRELAEETGLVAEEVRAFGHSSNPALETFTFANGDRIQAYVAMFEVVRWSGTLVSDPREALGHVWAAPESLPEMLPVMRASVEAFQRYRKTGEYQAI
jgi:ADP-ribose pyrophosphatase YjhB (NUDIX family)